MRVHTSLDKVRLDTSTEAPLAELAPIIPVQPSWSFQNGKMSLIFSTHIGNYYQIKWTNDLANAGPVSTWSNLGSTITGDGNPVEVTDEGSNEQDSRFYSVIITNQ